MAFGRRRHHVGADRRRRDIPAGRGDLRPASRLARRGDRPLRRRHRARGPGTCPRAGSPPLPAGVPLGADGNGPGPSRQLHDHRRQPVARRDAAAPDRRPRRPQHPRDHPSRRPQGGGGAPGAPRAGDRRHLPARSALRAQRRRATSGRAPRVAVTEDDGVAAGDHPHRGRHRAAARRRPAALGRHPRRAHRAAQPHRAAGAGRRAARRSARRLGGAVVHRPRQLQGGQRQPRPRHRRPSAVRARRADPWRGR